MKKIILSGIFIILSLCLTFVCGCNKYNAVVSSKVNKEISVEFLKENRVKAYYVEEETGDLFYDENAPDYRNFIITSNDEFNKIFTNTDLTVDFEKEMVLLYIFGDDYPSRDYFLKNISLDGQTLNVKIKLEKRDVCDATMPFQRCLMVKLDKLDVVAVNFEILYK